jgi:anti-sigma factor ChrR (cupin superfamily)
MATPQDNIIDSTSIHSDFSQRIVITPKDYLWQSSLIGGVEQMVLEHAVGDGLRSSSIIRYIKNSILTGRLHGNQEFYVLEGIYSDESGEHAAGSYLRYPAGVSHTYKIGTEGATLFLKSNQIGKGDLQQVIMDTNVCQWRQGLVEGLNVISLHEFEGEHVALVKWAPHTQFNTHKHWGGEEIFVLEGIFHDEYGQYSKGSWLRSPHLSQHTPYTEKEGALIYVKVGHLIGHK